MDSSSPQPTSFTNGRYQVKRFWGEGGKKKVYLARDSILDREVAFALIKTEGLDETSARRRQWADWVPILCNVRYVTLPELLAYDV